MNARACAYSKPKPSMSARSFVRWASSRQSLSLEDAVSPPPAPALDDFDAALWGLPPSLPQPATMSAPQTRLSVRTMTAAYLLRIAVLLSLWTRPLRTRLRRDSELP